MKPGTKLNNQAMQAKLEDGRCVDLNANRTIGPYYILTAEQAEVAEQGGVDFADSGHEAWIWSIAEVERDFKFERDGHKYTAHPGVVLASRSADLYQRAGMKCLWLR